MLAHVESLVCWASSKFLVNTYYPEVNERQFTDFRCSMKTTPEEPRGSEIGGGEYIFAIWMSMKL